MKSWTSIVCCAFLVGVAVVSATQRGTVTSQRAAGDVSDSWLAAGTPYEVDPNWPQPLHPDLTWSRTGAIFAESPNRVYVLQTGELPVEWKRAKDPAHPNWPNRASPEAAYCATPGYTCAPGDGPIIDTRAKKAIPGSRWEHLLMIVDAQGKLVESWEQHNHLLTHPHGIVINPSDPERHVWVIDDGSEQIFKFTHDGKRLVMTLGEFRVKGSDKTHLGGPNGMAFLPNGDFYVSDGYKNARVVKFSKDGKYLMEWGKPGKGPGEFNTPHSVAIGPDGRIYVGDRGNLRIQIFDKDANYISEIRDVYPNALAVSNDQRYLWVAQGGPDAKSRILKYDLNGKLLYVWERPYGAQPGQLWGVHDFSSDSEGNLYLAESWGGRAWKFRPTRGADPALLVGRLARNAF